MKGHLRDRRAPLSLGWSSLSKANGSGAKTPKPLIFLILVAGAGFEPATFGL